MNSYVLGFQEIDKTKLAIVGGKGANLGELSRIEGIQVPEGFCVTTEAYKEIIGTNDEFKSLLDQLSFLKADDSKGIDEISAKIRNVIEGIAIPKDIDDEITRHLAQLGEKNAYAVRSSATAEDLPTASFAGQQDTYLNIIGKEAILKHISKCWASLFADRAVIYRIQNGFDHRKVHLAVVIQQMVFPEAAGIMFTADPITGNRKVLSIDASFGLGEALVSGLVNADNYKVREGRIVDKKISTKKLAIYALKEGGTEEKKIEDERQSKQTLTDEQILQLEKIGRTIEAYFGRPQDIEWCLYDNKFFIVQSRPITTLYPIPDAHDEKIHVYMSFGHQQMMTDAMKPLGLSFFQLISDDFPLTQAGGRLFIDLAHDMASPIGRMIVLKVLANADPLMYNAIKKLMKRKDFMKALARGKRVFSMGSGYFSWALIAQFVKILRKNDGSLVQILMSQNEAHIKELQQKIANLSGDELFDCILKAVKQLKEDMSSPQSMGAVFAGVYAVNWINKKMEKWLGEKNAADLLSQKARKMISRLRNFVGYREYPKYIMVGYYWVIKQALLKEASRLMQKGVIREKQDIYYLSFEELREVVRTNRLNYSIITKRKEEYEVYEKLTTPRIMTSEGEVISGEYDTGNIPKGALAGIPASSGIVEGRARVVLRMEDADLEEGDILVTAYTDPSWTPVFISIKGLVTEVGGMMTHGSVIAREYGLPAVVGVENATRLIKDGQRIRVNGVDGYVEIL